MPCFEDLPIELLHIICASLDQEKVPQFRLLNPDCASVGIEYVVRELDIFAHRKSLERLERISLSRLAPYVRTLMYDTAVLDPPRVTIEERVMARLAVEDQEHLLSTGRANRILSTAISRLVNLKAFSIDNDCNVERKTGTTYEGVSEKHLYFLQCQYWIRGTPLMPVLRSIAQSFISLRRLHFKG